MREPPVQREFSIPMSPEIISMQFHYHIKMLNSPGDLVGLGHLNVKQKQRAHVERESE